jgi:hypothetical protein
MRFERAVQRCSFCTITRVVEGNRLGVLAGPRGGCTLTDDLAVKHHDSADRRTRRNSALRQFGQFNRSVKRSDSHDTSILCCRSMTA